MLLGMAIEYTEAMNEHEVPNIVGTLERVAYSETQKFADDLYEKTHNYIKSVLNEDTMPKEDGEINQLFKDQEL